MTLQKSDRPHSVLHEIPLYLDGVWVLLGRGYLHPNRQAKLAVRQDLDLVGEHRLGLVVQVYESHLDDERFRRIGNHGHGKLIEKPPIRPRERRIKQS